MTGGIWEESQRSFRKLRSYKSLLAGFSYFYFLVTDMNYIYFDNSATTELSERAKARMREVMEVYGNPSSLHPLGNSAHEILETARRQVGETLGVRRPEPGELIFTSCGSESDNLAILGTAYAKPRRKGMRIITTDSEHPGAENAMRALESQGFEVVRIRTRGGELDWEQYGQALGDRVFLVSMMMVNNETGALYDLKRAFAMAKATRADIVTHTDAVQGYLKCRFTPKSIGADLVTVSAHKIHGPKGVGALYVSPEARKRRDIVPVLLGGGQEDGFRSGTENLIGIAGFGEAASEGYARLNESIEKMRSLREQTLQALAELPLQWNHPAGQCAPHILNCTLPDIRSETMLHALAAKGICVSNGSACSSHSKHTSTALLAFGLTAEQAECSIRISFSEYNTPQEVEALATALREELSRLVHIHR